MKPESETESWVFDAWAVLAWLKLEPKAEAVDKILSRAAADGSRVIINLVNLGEIYYKLLSAVSPRQADQALNRFKHRPFHIQHLNLHLVKSAGRLKNEYRIPYVDSIAAATAIRHGCALVTGDSDFIPVEKAGLLKILWLR